MLPKNELKNIVKSLPSSKGRTYLLILIENPCQQIPYIYFENMTPEPITIATKNRNLEKFIQIINDEDIIRSNQNEISYCDFKTIKDILTRMTVIRRKLTNYERENEFTTLEEEYIQLEIYLKQVFSKTGFVKKMPSLFSVLIASIKKNIYRAMIDIKKINEPAYITLKNSIEQDRNTISYIVKG